MITNKQIVDFFRSKETKAGFVDRLKIRYRPYICPFGILIEMANGKKSVFDIGCGSGQFCMLIENFTPVKKISGIEISKRLVNNANALKSINPQKEINFLVFDGKTIPESIADHEIVYLIDVFHHVPKAQQKEFITEVYKKMRKGSTLVFKDIDKAHPFVVFNKIHDLIFSKEIGREISLKSALAMLTQSGFTIERSFKKRVFVYPHYFIVATK